MRTDQEMPPETRRNHVGSSIIEGPWPAVTSGFLVGETPELQLGTSMLLLIPNEVESAPVAASFRRDQIDTVAESQQPVLAV